jgi:hypothetical protein
MGKVTKMSNVSVSMESALGASVTISSITKATPGVVTTGAVHSLVVGDYVLMTVNGMFQLNDRVFRVATGGFTTTAFQLEDISGGTGISTLLMDTFSSGSVQKITFGTTITTVANMTSSGGEFDFKDTSLIHNNFKSQIPGSASPVSFTMEHLWDLTDSGQQALVTASNAQAKKSFKFVYGTGGVVQVFTGYVGYVGVPSGQAQDVLKSSATITANGLPTFYSA